MTRGRAFLAEIARGAHQAFAEMMLPETIDDDPGGKWIGRVGDPMSKSETAFLVRGSRITILLVQLRQATGFTCIDMETDWNRAERAGIDDLALLHRITPRQAMNWLGFFREFTGINRGKIG